MTPMDTIAVEREVRVRARPETIFPFFTDPELMVRWMGSSAEVEPSPGGIFRVEVSGSYVARGEYVEVSPPDHVVFTWGWESEDSPVRPGSSTVEVTLRPDGEETLVRLVHRDLPSEDSAGAHGRGWDHYLDRLRVAGAGGDPGPDPGIGQASTQAD
ncbi:MAG TPA: SRPBCC family protein [Solirubrobacterales bacterium]|nr:SRPBCC family protein [Solirubrobacterales bacterium]